MSDYWILLTVIAVLLLVVYEVYLLHLLTQNIRDRLCARRESMLAHRICPRCRGPLAQTEQHIEAAGTVTVRGPFGEFWGYCTCSDRELSVVSPGNPIC